MGAKIEFNLQVFHVWMNLQILSYQRYARNNSWIHFYYSFIYSVS